MKVWPRIRLWQVITALLLAASSSRASFNPPVAFRGHGHLPLAPASLSVHAGSTGDTLVMNQPAGGGGGIVTLAGASQAWEVALGLASVGVGDSIEFGGAAIVSGGDPPIRMLSAARELTEKLRLVVQGVLKARRKNGEGDT